MDRLDSLEIFAEIGIALAGFSGVAAAIAGRSPAGLAPRQRPGFWTVLAAGFSLAILALLPRAIANFGVPEPAVWRVLCLGVSPGFVLLWVLLWRNHRQLERSGHPAYAPRAYPIGGVIAAALSLGLVLAALGALPGFAAYYAALVALIGIAANGFILFLLTGPRE